MYFYEKERNSNLRRCVQQDCTKTLFPPAIFLIPKSKILADAKMESVNLCTDVLAVRFIGGFILVGMGPMLYIYKETTNVLIMKINLLNSTNIHGIVEGVSNNKILVFGQNLFRICKLHGALDEKIIEVTGNAYKTSEWIIAVQWLENDSKLCFLLAHNKLEIYDIASGKIQHLQCEDKCILYGGSISGHDLNKLVVLSGTVFQEILIWQPKHINNDGGAKVLHRLSGHKGVIFSAIYDELSNLICSTSDDRTIRLWKVRENAANEKEFVWENATVTLEKTIFGHTARVWKAMMRNDCIMSIGEDSLLCKWSIDGKLVEKIEAHHGAAIWSVDISQDNKIIITGGANGAVHMWPFNSTVPEERELFVEFEVDNFIPKYLCYMKHQSLVVFRENGILSIYNYWTFDHKENITVENFKGYCLMQVSPCRSKVALASQDGYIAIYEESDDRSSTSGLENTHRGFKIMDAKIYSLQWLSSERLLVCGPEGLLKIVCPKNDMIEEHFLPPSRERWVTAAITWGDLLICGDRMGTVYVYKSDRLEPVQVYRKIHGSLGVQSCSIVCGKLVTAGRDGMLRYYTISTNESLPLQILRSIKMPMDWVHSILQTDDDFLVFGFKEVYFVIYSMKRQRILIDIPCGGGHRSWDILLENGNINFAYIRNKKIFYDKLDLHQVALPSLTMGFHSKEILSMKSLQVSGKFEEQIFISGSEDCTLRLSALTDIKSVQNSKLNTFTILDGHISSVKTIAHIKIQENSDTQFSKFLVFSGGGRAQLKVWEIIVNNESEILGDYDIQCRDLLSYMLRENNHNALKSRGDNGRSFFIDPETRFLDIDVVPAPDDESIVILFIACADGYIRILSYNISINKIDLLDTIFYKNRCILKVCCLCVDKRHVLLSMATDGAVNFWEVTKIIRRRDRSELSSEEIPLVGKINLHQSGINCYSCNRISNNKFLFATGGDDNAVNLISFEIKTLETLSIDNILYWSASDAHSTQVAGIAFDPLGERFYSVGVDQCFNVFKYHLNENTISAILLSETNTSVSDVQGMTLFYHESLSYTNVCIYGKGFEILKIESCKEKCKSSDGRVK